jgi:predicted TPR repeat methyltransferase
VALEGRTTIRPQAPGTTESALTDLIEKFDRLAAGYREHDYADADRYFAHKARLVADLAPRLEPGDTILDYGSGDGALATPLVRRALVYHGIDASAAMVETARRREPNARFDVGTIETYVPPEPVDCIVTMRTLYLVGDRRGFFERARANVRKKLVFDFDPRVQPERVVLDELRSAGFGSVSVRPFLMAQRRRLPAPLQSLLFLAEPTPAARLVLRTGFPPRLLVTATA